MSSCEQELCRNWSGSGCVCAVFDLEPDTVSGRSGWPDDDYDTESEELFTND